MRRVNAIRRVVAVLTAGGLLCAAPAAAERQGYLVRIAGRVVSVDRAHGTIVLRHGMLETTSPGVETCLLPPRLLKYFRAGMELTARADTSRRPWRLTEVQHLRVRRDPPARDPRLASLFDEVTHARAE
jgi:hypothetical protein